MNKFKTIRECMLETGYELVEGYNYESVYPFRGLLDFRKANVVLTDAVQMKIIKKIK